MQQGWRQHRIDTASERVATGRDRDIDSHRDRLRDRLEDRFRSHRDEKGTHTDRCSDVTCERFFVSVPESTPPLRSLEITLPLAWCGSHYV